MCRESVIDSMQLSILIIKILYSNYMCEYTSRVYKCTWIKIKEMRIKIEKRIYLKHIHAYQSKYETP